MSNAGTVKIGKYEVGRLWLAPMAGYTDIAFRELCKGCGAGFTVTEMVSVRGLVYGSEATSELMRVSPVESPSCVQLFGSEPDDFARAASLVQSDIIDVNMGCPMPKIVKNGDGSALLRDPKRAGRIVAALADATDKPITVKTRLGFGNGDDCAGELIERVTEAGASAVTVHGRYAEQRYSGVSDAAKAEALAKSARIPVIYSGDANAENAERLLKVFSAVMIGRAALGNPAVFTGGVCDPFETARRHVRLLSQYFDERYTVNQARKFFVHYFKGVSGGKALRAAVNAASSVAQVYAALDKGINPC